MIIVLICLALGLYALDQVPMKPPLNWIIRVLIIIVAVLFLLHLAGLA